MDLLESLQSIHENLQLAYTTDDRSTVSYQVERALEKIEKLIEEETINELDRSIFQKEKDKRCLK